MYVSHSRKSQEKRGSRLATFFTNFFIAIIRFCCSFPSLLSFVNTRFCLVSFLVIIIVNLLFFWEVRLDPYYGHYFAIIVSGLTHVTLLVYIFVWYYRETFFQKMMADFLCDIQTNGRLQYSHFVLSIVFISWNILCILQLLDGSGQRLMLITFLYLEKLAIVLFETQICIILLNIKKAIHNVRNKIVSEIEKQNMGKRAYYLTSIDDHQLGRYDIFWLENVRKVHLTICTTMNRLNCVYGVPNTILTIRERFSFAFYLYFWLTRNRILDLILGSANFCRVGVVFCCFQSLKNEETLLKSVVNELPIDFPYYLENKKLEYLVTQIQVLDTKFEACGLFSMDLSTVISLLTTTAGYLLLLNQLNL